jgi:hypothetical protein
MFFSKYFLFFTYFRYLYINIHGLHVIKKSQNSRNQGFYIKILLVDERIRILYSAVLAGTIFYICLVSKVEI